MVLGEEVLGHPLNLVDIAKKCSQWLHQFTPLTGHLQGSRAPQPHRPWVLSAIYVVTTGGHVMEGFLVI